MIGFWRRHWWVDCVVALVAVTLIRQSYDYAVLQQGDPNNLYLAVVSISAALGTLALTPIAIVLALTPGPRLRALLAHHVAIVRRSMAWAVFANIVAVAVGLLGITADVERQPLLGVRHAALGLEFAALLAMTRLVWFFLAMLIVDEVDKDGSPSS